MSKNTCMKKEMGWDKVKHVYLYTICALTICGYRGSDKQEVDIIMRRVEMGKSDACVFIYSDKEMGNRIHVYIIINTRGIYMYKSTWSMNTYLLVVKVVVMKMSC